MCRPPPRHAPIPPTQAPIPLTQTPHPPYTCPHPPGGAKVGEGGGCGALGGACMGAKGGEGGGGTTHIYFSAPTTHAYSNLGGTPPVNYLIFSRGRGSMLTAFFSPEATMHPYIFFRTPLYILK